MLTSALLAYLHDLGGIALALLTLLLLALAGLSLSERFEERDSLTFVARAFVLATAVAITIVLVLGTLRVLTLPSALVALGLVVAVAGRQRAAVARLAPIAASARRRIVDAPILYLLVAHVLAYETLRGLIRPPLTHDALMYHLPLAVTWLQERAIEPLFGPYPLNYQGLNPANGSAWLWWWIAPTHSDLLANVAFVPFALLLALATGGVARECGAERFHLAAAIVVPVPVIARFVATAYVDVFFAAMIVSASFFALRWCRTAAHGDAAIAGLALGIAIGAKGLGLPYAVGVALALAVAARAHGRKRVVGLLWMGAAVVALGSYFYVRNATLGYGPFAHPALQHFVGAAVQCDAARDNPIGIPAVAELTLARHFFRMLDDGKIAAAILGTARGIFVELGLGPGVFVAACFGLVSPAWIARRRVALAVVAAVVVHLVVWCTVPAAYPWYIYANVRYLDATVALLLALAVTGLEARVGHAVVLAATVVALQSLFHLDPRAPQGVRYAIVLADVAAAVVLLTPAIRAHARTLSVGAAAAAVLAAPILQAFREEDRARALADDVVAHASVERPMLAGAWRYLDQQAGARTVAVSIAPIHELVLPFYGARFERKVIHVPAARFAGHRVTAYDNCDPRRAASREAWIDNLARARPAFVVISRVADQGPWPPEHAYAPTVPGLTPRYRDPWSVVYERSEP